MCAEDSIHDTFYHTDVYHIDVYHTDVYHIDVSLFKNPLLICGPQSSQSRCPPY